MAVWPFQVFQVSSPNKSYNVENTQPCGLWVNMNTSVVVIWHTDNECDTIIKYTTNEYLVSTRFNIYFINSYYKQK